MLKQPCEICMAGLRHPCLARRPARSQLQGWVYGALLPAPPARFPLCGSQSIPQPSAPLPPSGAMFFSVSSTVLSLHGMHSWHVVCRIAEERARGHIEGVATDLARFLLPRPRLCDTGQALNSPPSANVHPADGESSSLAYLPSLWIWTSVQSSGSTLREWSLFSCPRSSPSFAAWLP